jgi:hypothetical protein
MDPMPGSRVLLAWSCLALLACAPQAEEGAVRTQPSTKVDPNDLTVCGGSWMKIGLVQPNAFLVLDRSASMTSALDASGTSRRWDDLKAAVSSVVTSFDEEVRFGMSLFSQGDGCEPGVIDVPLGKHTGESLLRALDAARPAGTTPTGPTLDYVRQHAGLDDPSRPNVVILATDGLPNCGDTDVLGKITALYNSVPPVRTFVIGIGAEISSEPGLLDSWAIAGHTERAGPVKYYPSGSAAELLQSLEDVVEGLRTCSFPVPKPPADLGKIYIQMAGEWLPRAEHIGFMYRPAEGVVTLTGPTCDAFKLNPTQTLDLVYGCPDAGPVL